MKAICWAVILGCLPAWVASSGAQSPSADDQRVRFEPVPASETGITWVHENGKSPERHLPETVGAGCAFFDYNNDGWMDIYFVNSGEADFFSPQKPLRNALYHNNGDGTFTDITEEAGLAGGAFGMGAYAGDYDGDGWQDLYVTHYGADRLYRNNGDGTFSDVTREAGVAALRWTTCAVWFDYDKDSHLDLFVSSFVHYDPEENRYCGEPAGERQHYCIPRVFKPAPSYLFRNRGDGTFEDVSQASGIASVEGKAFGAVATDINNDGWLDLFVANDTTPNFLFLNLGDGTFEEVGLLAGVAYSDAGNPRSGMGVDAIDYDQDGRQDLFVANIDKEMFSLYRNRGDLDFFDASAEIRRQTRMLSGWGLRFFDYDNDGDEDLFLANGHPDDRIRFINPAVSYEMRLKLFENKGGEYEDVSAVSGEVFSRKLPARGMAAGDYDNDGDVDVLIANNGGPPLLLRNNGGNRNHWIGLELTATESNPAAAGAVIVWEAGGVRRRFKRVGGSYLASHDPREILGLGRSPKAERVEIRWPGGKVDAVSDVAAGRYIRIAEGRGIQAEGK